MIHNRGTRLINVPILFHNRGSLIHWATVQDSGVTVLEGRFPSGLQIPSTDLGDGWELVRQFLAIKEGDEKSLLSFLVAHGFFQAPEELRIRKPLPKLPALASGAAQKPSPVAEVLLERYPMKTFTAIADYLRRMLTTRNATLPMPWSQASRGNRVYQYTISFAGVRSISEAHVEVSGIFPSMMASIQFKLIQGAIFRICARRDCRLPFEVTSRHTRRFCSQYCAHITSLRQRRKAERKAKDEGKI